MRFEGDRDGLAAASPPALNEFSQNVRMRAVNAVEIAYADECWPEVRRHFFEFVKYTHRKEIVDC